MQTVLKREAFATSRLLDFFSRKELTAQIGHAERDWPLVALKELVDNALDACEDQGIAPDIDVTVDEKGIAVKDNGPGLALDTVEKMLDFSIRVSSREAYVSPTRGAQGNALKTLVAMPFVLDGERGSVEVETHGARYLIRCEVDRIRQMPLITHDRQTGFVKTGTFVKVHWPYVWACLVNLRLGRHARQAGKNGGRMNLPPHTGIRPLISNASWAPTSPTIPGVAGSVR